MAVSDRRGSDRRSFPALRRSGDGGCFSGELRSVRRRVFCVGEWCTAGPRLHRSTGYTPIAPLGGPAWCCVNWGPRSHIGFPLSWSEPAACHLPPDVIFGDMSFIQYSCQKMHSPNPEEIIRQTQLSSILRDGGPALFENASVTENKK